MKRVLFSPFTLTLIIYGIFILQSFSSHKAYSTLHILFQPNENGYNSTKVIILGFDDSPKSQFILAKPILDKYGYKGSFFTVCSYVNKGSEGKDKSRMNWQDIITLQQQGHDIESHTMNHTNLDFKPTQDLLYEVAGSKLCLLDHGINSTIFAYPASTGNKNVTVVNAVSRYYDLARSGDAPMAFLHCNGYKIEYNCNPFNKNGVLTYENRYDIRNWSDRPKSQGPNQVSVPINSSQMLTQFIEEVNLQKKYNKNGCINAIPIDVYHDFILDSKLRYLPNKSVTEVGLFSAEMKYLYDNGFKVLKMSDLGYNTSTNYLYVKEPDKNYIKNC